MAKYCSNCGHELPEGKRFCANCGTAVDGTAQPKWEYCEIRYRIDKVQSETTKRTFLNVLFREDVYYFDIIFFAQGIGPNGTFKATTFEPHGRYVTGENPSSAPPYASDGELSASNEANERAINALVKKLTESGWETLPDTGKHWYSYKFRRLVKG